MNDTLLQIHNFVVSSKHESVKRYLYDLIDFTDRAICITGARGTGKTTLLIQYYHEAFGNPLECLYISADNVQITADGLFQTAMEFFRYGGRALLIDEIHKYENWSQELKNILDTFGDRQVIVSGSSSLDLRKGKADLSRRLSYYDLKDLSFREFLIFRHGRSRGKIHDPYPLPILLKEHTTIAAGLTQETSILREFRDYLTYGSYPYFMEGKAGYHSKLINTLEKVIFEDIASVFNMKQANLWVIKKLLKLIGDSQPFIANIAKLSREFGTSKEYIYNYLEYLDKAGLIVAVHRQAQGYRAVRKPEKIYFRNTNLLHAITGNLDWANKIGGIRETFFANQLNHLGLAVPLRGDFMVDNTYTIEIGGKNKTDTQIRGIPNSYVAADDIEISSGTTVPLYLFGFLY